MNDPAVSSCQGRLRVLHNGWDVHTCRTPDVLRHRGQSRDLRRTRPRFYAGVAADPELRALNPEEDLADVEERLRMFSSSIVVVLRPAASFAAIRAFERVMRPLPLLAQVRGQSRPPSCLPDDREATAQVRSCSRRVGQP